MAGVATKLNLWLFILHCAQPEDFLTHSPELRLAYAAARDAAALWSVNGSQLV